ncbi:hypothetical protein BV22DRAFT_1038165 [Leucogyrophana mollusca]|uniref:Uncharacterized protein n=1 Tax=Leucogyrophana mollusca TaxID=85980 RepID=A0ACB8B7Y8_9AGAM|nr:hypothetical protein BV22DRAFT_1038165 [Leucogyrophana mollusca]
MTTRAGSSRLGRRAAVVSGYEDDLLELVAQLSLEDIESIQTAQGNKTSAGAPLTDHEVALGLLLQNAREVATFNSDRALALELAEAEEVRQVIIADQMRGNPVPTVAAARQPTPQTPTAPPPAAEQTPNRTNQNASQAWGGWITSMVGWMFSGSSSQSSDSVPAAPTKPIIRRRVATGHTCVVCQDPIYNAEVRAPCGHFYGIDCVTDLFQSATRDETLYPPRCCRQIIDVAQVERHLSADLVRLFREKAVEFGTLKRVYCATPTCSRFLGPLYEGFFTKFYTCPARDCATKTCGKCRASHAERQSCTTDNSSDEILAFSRRAGWARCPGCAQMIELNMGCFHMTCRCKTEFCYLCTSRWKSCRCPQWDETRLLAAAEQRVELQFGPARHVPAQQLRQEPAQAHPLLHRVDPVPYPAAVRAPPVAVRAPPAAVRRWPPVHVPAQPPVPARPPPPIRNVAAPAPPAVAAPAPPATTTAQPPARAPTNPLAPAVVPVPVAPGRRASAARTQAETWDQFRQRMVRDTMDELRVNHDCQHSSWRYRRGGGRCESCHMHLPHYLFRCGGCLMTACNRCRRNRL